MNRTIESYQASEDLRKYVVELEKQRDKLLKFLKSDNWSLMVAKELIAEVESKKNGKPKT